MATGTTRPGSLRVALLAEEGERHKLRALLECVEVDLVLDQRYDMPFPCSWNGAEVLLLGVSPRSEKSQIEHVLREVPVPVLINTDAGGVVQIQRGSLLGRLRALADCAKVTAAAPAQRSRPQLCVVQGARSHDGFQQRVVVLGASIGGPEAVKAFFQALPPDLPAVFLLAQHISESYQNLLIEQLRRCSDWSVGMPGDRQKLETGQVWMVPANTRFEMDLDGVIHSCQRTWGSIHRPDIDEVLRNVARVCGDRAGAIIFSGVGDDGASGCVAVKESGGFAWAQNPESCAISNMPEAARRAGAIDYNGTPEELARALTSRCQPESTNIN